MTITTFAIHAAGIAVGVFFALSGYHKLTHKGRRAQLVSTLEGINLPCVPFFSWWVPGWEFVGGLMLISLWPPAVLLGGLALITICLVAGCTEGRSHVASFNPLNKADRLDCWLYLPEILYIIILLVVMAQAAQAIV